MTQLSEELATIRKQLQEAHDRAAAHACAPTPPPRPYGQLLTDLRQECPPFDSPQHTRSPSPSPTSVLTSVLRSDRSSSSTTPPPSDPSSSTSVLQSELHRLSPSPVPPPFPPPQSAPGLPSSASIAASHLAPAAPTSSSTALDVSLPGHSLNDAVAVEIGDGVTRGCDTRSIGSSPSSSSSLPSAHTPASSPTRHSPSSPFTSVDPIADRPLPFSIPVDVPQIEPIDTTMIRVGAAWLEARRRVHVEGTARRRSLNVALNNICAALRDVRGCHHSSPTMSRHPPLRRSDFPSGAASLLGTDRTAPSLDSNNAVRGRVSMAVRVSDGTAFMDTIGGKSRKPVDEMITSIVAPLRSSSTPLAMFPGTEPSLPLHDHLITTSSPRQISTLHPHIVLDSGLNLVSPSIHRLPCRYPFSISTHSASPHPSFGAHQLIPAF
ncbi:hypothetical protein CF326_g9673 [Tilletia indica]|nr:hypothetical protein CF326_g9673 [Tilletia indica]